MSNVCFPFVTVVSIMLPPGFPRPWLLLECWQTPPGLFVSDPQIGFLSFLLGVGLALAAFMGVWTHKPTLSPREEISRIILCTQRATIYL